MKQLGNHGTVSPLLWISNKIWGKGIWPNVCDSFVFTPSLEIRTIKVFPQYQIFTVTSGFLASNRLAIRNTRPGRFIQSWAHIPHRSVVIIRPLYYGQNGPKSMETIWLIFIVFFMWLLISSLTSTMVWLNHRWCSAWLSNYPDL